MNGDQEAVCREILERAAARHAGRVEHEAVFRIFRRGGIIGIAVEPGRNGLGGPWAPAVFVFPADFTDGVTVIIAADQRLDGVFQSVFHPLHLGLHSPNERLDFLGVLFRLGARLLATLGVRDYFPRRARNFAGDFLDGLLELRPGVEHGGEKQVLVMQVAVERGLQRAADVSGKLFALEIVEHPVAGERDVDRASPIIAGRNRGGGLDEFGTARGQSPGFTERAACGDHAREVARSPCRWAGGRVVPTPASDCRGGVFLPTAPASYAGQRAGRLWSFYGRGCTSRRSGLGPGRSLPRRGLLLPLAKIGFIGLSSGRNPRRSPWTCGPHRPAAW